MPTPHRRLAEADAIFLPMSAAVRGTMAPLGVAVLERRPDPGAIAHQRELFTRLVPQTRQRIVRDRASLALPRWVDVPDVDLAEQWFDLAAPGDGSLRAALDWAARWAALPFPEDRPPWRAAQLDGVEVDGERRTLLVTQIHHAIIDAGGARRMAEHYYRFEPDAPLAPLPPEPRREDLTEFERWKEGWALEGTKARAALGATKGRLARAAEDPRAAARRARELARAAQRLLEPNGPEPLSPVLRRRSDRMRFDDLRVDIAALKAGARAASGTVNDGFMAAVSLGLQAYHRDLGVRLPAVRTAMAVNRRPVGTSWDGNDVLAVVVHLPMDDDDPARLVKRCHEVSRQARDDEDVLWLLDRVRAAGNRMPFAVSVALARRNLAGLDVSLSNIAGLPTRRWIAGVEQLRSTPFVVGTLSAVAMVMTSRGDVADLGLTTCPEAIPDPEHLVACLQAGLGAVEALAI